MSTHMHTYTLCLYIYIYIYTYTHTDTLAPTHICINVLKYTEPGTESLYSHNR